jgi:hypothetical protein
MLFKKKKKYKPRPQDTRVMLTKKCPKCYTYLPLNATRCTACHAKVGKMDRHGMATLPINWRAYLVAILSWIAFGWFIWWAFFKDK